MATLVVAALAQVGGRTAWLAAILAGRHRRPVSVAAMAGLAIALASSAAALGGTLLGPRLTPEARQIFLGLSLLMLGGGALLRVRRPDPLGHRRLGAATTSLLGLLVLAFGDGLQFVVLALAMQSTMPWLAVAGSTIGSLAVIIGAIAIGERHLCELPLRAGRFVIGVIFIVTGVALSLAALGLT